MEKPLIDVTLRFERQGGLWLTCFPSAWGPVEVTLDGDEKAPKASQLEALTRFLEEYPEVLVHLRKKLRPAFLYRPIRLVVSVENRVGVQYRNRLTGAQSVVDEQPSA